MKKLYIFFIAMAMLLAGCGQGNKVPQATLTIQPPARLAEFAVDSRLQQNGSGNTCRVVSGTALGAPAALELAAGADGLMSYAVESADYQPVRAKFRVQFLSTQGAGRILLEALDIKRQVIAAEGWLITGKDMPAGSGHWRDLRTNANYMGTWQEEDVPVSNLFAAVPGVVSYRLSVIDGYGQHVLITDMRLVPDNSLAVRITPQQRNYRLSVGETIDVAVDVENKAAIPIAANIAFVEPYGLGITTGEGLQTVTLQPHEHRLLSWQATARRSTIVNAGRNWQAGFALDGQAVAGSAVDFAVADQRPGRIFYLMTEDLEPIDAAGYPTAWGNCNGWIDPEELTVQMIGKSERLNDIAAQYGAKWTHYIAWPAVRAAEWAAGQAGSQAWTKVAADMKRSVEVQTGRGAEYAIHMHSDYDPYLAGNVLSYNAGNDGLWANHRQHGWAHSIYAEGTFEDYNSRTGILYSYQRELDALAAKQGKGQILDARAGSFDFGHGSEDETRSVAAYRHIGLWGTSDAAGNAGGITAGPYELGIYFTKADDIDVPADDIHSLGLVEVRPTPQVCISYNSDSAAVLNAKAAQGVAAFMENGQVKPGVHAIVGFTHAMFMMGADGWKDMYGGQFAVLDEHLRYLKDTFADNGILSFATVSDAVKAYLDYYVPEPVGIYGRILADNLLYTEYAIDILGHDIVIDEAHPHEINMKYPLYMRQAAYHLEVRQAGQKVYSTWGLPTPFNDVRFTADRHDGYTLRVYHNSLLSRLLQKYRQLHRYLAG